MTTQRDLEEAAAARDLPICGQCGWYATMNHHKECDPAEGRVAQALIAAVPEVRSGQLGHGDGHVAFDIEEDLCVTFRVDRDGTDLNLSDVHLIHRLTLEETADLVRAIDGWWKRTRRGRGELDRDDVDAP